MDRYYFKKGFRNLYRKKFFSLVKISGITLAFIPFMLIWSFVSYESGYDRYLSENDRVFRVIANFQEDKIVGTSIPVPFQPSLLGFLTLLFIGIQRRTREIGVRKVNGTRTWEIIRLSTQNL